MPTRDEWKSRALAAESALATARADASYWKAKYDELVAQIVKAMQEQQNPPPPPPPPTTGVIFGVNPGSAVDWHLDLHVPVVGWKHIRVDAGLGENPSAFPPNVQKWVAAGYKPLICLSWDRGRMPTTAEAQNAGEWARVMQGIEGVTALELGNENLMNYGGAPYTDAAGYARAAKTAHDAIAGRIPLIIQCDGNDSESIPKMKAAVPEIGTCAEGWVTHSYWPNAKQYLTDLKARIKGIGGNGELWLTEWGFVACPTDAGLVPDSYGWGTDIDNATVANRIASVWADIKPLSKAVYWYCATDFYWTNDYDVKPWKREQRFGACVGDKQPKPYVADACKKILTEVGA